MCAVSGVSGDVVKGGAIGPGIAGQDKEMPMSAAAMAVVAVVTAWVVVRHWPRRRHWRRDQ